MLKKLSEVVVLIAVIAGSAGAANGQVAAKPVKAVEPPSPMATMAPIHRAIYQLNDEVATGPISLVAGTYSVFHTSDGDFIVLLNSTETPNSAKNFIDLALGKKSWRHPVTMVESTKPLYNNTTIYRIIPDTIIFGGDPINKGSGDSGALLPLETSPDQQFNQGGLLAMDGNGSQSSGSRWFITLRPFPDRNGHYTIIGKVVGGLDVISTISNKPTKKPQVPLDATLLSSVEIVEIPQGKKTTATFSTEDGRRVLSVDPNFTEAEQPKPVVVETTTTTTAVTSGTVSSPAK